MTDTTKQLYLIKTENTILNEKVTHLNRLLEQQKSEYERTRALFEVKYNQQQYEYTNIINELQQKIEIQQNKFNKMERKLQNINQTVVNDHIEHENQLKLLTTQKQRYLNESNKMRQNNIIQSHEINRLKQELTQKDLDIVNLQRELHILTYSYEPLLPNSNRLSITKVAKISPNITPYQSPTSEISVSEFNITYAKRKTLSANDFSNISQHNKYRHILKPSPIDVSIIKLESEFSDFEDYIPTRTHLQVIKSSSSLTPRSSPSILNSATSISLDTSIDDI
eukprot:294511_1